LLGPISSMGDLLVGFAGELLRLAAHILDSRTAGFAPGAFRDRYEGGPAGALEGKADPASARYSSARRAACPPARRRASRSPRPCSTLIKSKALIVVIGQRWAAFFRQSAGWLSWRAARTIDYVRIEIELALSEHVGVMLGGSLAEAIRVLAREAGECLRPN
jgi:hypothetical protein